MASSLKIVLRRKAAPDGTYPLAIRITVDRKSSYLYLGQTIRESDWDAAAQRVKKSHPNSKWLNHFILQKHAEANAKLMDMGVQHKDISSKAVRRQLKPNAGASFFAQATQYVETFRAQGKFNRVSTEQPRLNQFKAFLKGSDITFPEITVGLLNKYKSHLKGKRGVCERTAMNHLIFIRTVFNQAIAEGLADRKHYPFGRGKILIKLPETVKIGLNADEVTALETVDLSSKRTYLNHARNLWLFSFYCAGMRASDVLRLKHADLQNGRLYYTMGKNAKSGSLKLSEKALRILTQYPKETSRHDLVFPDLQPLDRLDDSFEVQRKIAFAIRRVNTNLRNVAELAGITKKLTMHIPRHTFGNMAGDKISLQLLQKLYRHTSILTTIGYQGNFIHKDADEALEAVIG